MEIKPFSEDITTGRAEETIGSEGERNYNEVSQEPLDQPKIKAFSDDITTSDNISANRELTPEEKKLLKSIPENKKLPGFAGEYEKEQRDALLKMGFSKVEISDVEKLYRKGPETGYTRYTDPKIAPKGSDANVVIKAWGFADIDKDGFMHPDISYAE